MVSLVARGLTTIIGEREFLCCCLTKFKDWKGKLMYTNYAEESKAAYDKTGKFELLKSIEGYRHYLRFSFKDLLVPESVFFRQT